MMKKIISVVIIAAMLIAALTACSSGSGYPIFNGSRTGNDSQFIMTYTAFNTTDSQTLDVKAGDVIHAEITVEGGQLSYEIQRDNDEPIAVNKGISASEEFDVQAEKSGRYTVAVTGEKTKGSVIFVVKRAE